MERETLSKLSFLLFLNGVGGIFISAHLIEEVATLVIGTSL